MQEGPDSPSSTQGLRILRWFAVGFVVVGLVAFVFAQRDVIDAARGLRTADREWLFVAALAMAALLVNQALFHAAAQRAARLPTGPLGAVSPAWAATFLNQVTKSGGMAGLSMFFADGDRRRLGRGPVIAAYTLVAALTELAFALALGAALVVGWRDGRITAVDMIAAVIFAAYVIARIAIIAVAATSRAWLRRMYTLPGRVAGVVRRRANPDPTTRAADELYDALAIVRGEPLRWIPAAGHAIAVEAIGVVELWAVIAAVGGGHSLALALVAYAVSSMFAIVGVLPGGLGFVELSLGAVLISWGVPAQTAVAAVILYRVVELWIPVLVGACAAARLRRRAATVAP